jgi:hypothetical protein
VGTHIVVSLFAMTQARLGTPKPPVLSAMVRCAQKAADLAHAGEMWTSAFFDAVEARGACIQVGRNLGILRQEEVNPAAATGFLGRVKNVVKAFDFETLMREFTESRAWRIRL